MYLPAILPTVILLEATKLATLPPATLVSTVMTGIPALFASSTAGIRAWGFAGGSRMASTFEAMKDSTCAVCLVGSLYDSATTSFTPVLTASSSAPF